MKSGGVRIDAAAFTRNAAEMCRGDDLGYRLNARMNITQSFRMFNSLTRSGEYRKNIDAGATTSLTKLPTWKISPTVF